jgi:antitoxin ParD1/3/4
MRTTRQMSVTLPHEIAEMVRAKVPAGEYASESEVIRDGLRALRARDRAVDEWLMQEVVPAQSTATSVVSPLRARERALKRPISVAPPSARLAQVRSPRSDDGSASTWRLTLTDSSSQLGLSLPRRLEVGHSMFDDLPRWQTLYYGGTRQPEILPISTNR